LTFPWTEGGGGLGLQQPGPAEHLLLTQMVRAAAAPLPSALCTTRFLLLRPATLESGDLFGLFRSLERRKQQDWLIVYPKVLPLSELGLPAKKPFGDIRSQKRIFEDGSRTVG